jgi:tetratricopeptide (TPR) repeat protein
MGVRRGAIHIAILLAAAVLAAPAVRARADSSAAALEAAQRLFYTSRFSAAADRALQLITESPTDLAAFELRTSALHFQIRRASGSGKDRKAAMAACKVCPAVLEVFLAEFRRGRAAARQRLAEAPDDEQAMYYLAKMDTSYLFLQLSTLGKRTGWDEYWEAKRLLEKVLTKNPNHVRAQVARAWMDYIVGTRVPWGTRWVMGGGSRERGLRAMRAMAEAPGDFYTEVEADFALWEMLVREGKRDEALPVARELLGRFPENEELARFVSGSPSPKTED